VLHQGVILCLYIDDILIFGTSLDVINEVKTFLCQSFDMKYMGDADVILNIKLIKGENVITLTQSHHVEKVLSCSAIRTTNLLLHLMIPVLFFERTRELVDTN
jgi:hypothetical protein